MKQNDIFRLALQAGFKEGDLSLFPSLLTKFADLVAAEVGIAQWHRGFSEGQSVERAVCAKELRRLHAENEALRAQIGQGEPIGWLYDWTHSSALGKPDEQFTSFTNDEVHAHKHSNVRPVFDKQSTAPQQKPLTDEQINQMWSDAHNDTSTMSLIHVLARAIEAAHNIGEKK